MHLSGKALGCKLLVPTLAGLPRKKLLEDIWDSETLQGVKVLGLEAVFLDNVQGLSRRNSAHLPIAQHRHRGHRRETTPEPLPPQSCLSLWPLLPKMDSTLLGGPLPNEASWQSLCYLSPRCKGSRKSECEFPLEGEGEFLMPRIKWRKSVQ